MLWYALPPTRGAGDAKCNGAFRLSLFSMRSRGATSGPFAGSESPKASNCAFLGGRAWRVQTLS